MTLGGTAQVAAAHFPNERTLDPAVYKYNRPTYAPASHTMAFTHGGRHGRYLESMMDQKRDTYLLEEQSCQISSQSDSK